MKNLEANKATINSSTVVLTMLMVFLIGGYGAESDLLAQPTQEEDFYYANGDRIPVTIPLDRIGVIAREEVSANQIIEAIRPLGLGLVSEFPGGLFILSVGDTLTRNELVELARRVETQGGEFPLFRDAGLVLTTKDDPTPMIVTDEFIALFGSEVTREQIDAFNDSNNVEIVRPDSFVENQFLLTVTEASVVDALKMANLYHESPLTEFSHPNFWVVYGTFQLIPNDPLFGNQWHLHNTGQGGGAVDADADLPLAWDITTGNPNVIIAVFDTGFDLEHEDLAPNLFINPGETAGDNTDDDDFDGDPTTFVDDVNGWDFISNDNNPGAGAGENHGTAVAGVAAADGNNMLGVSGACPDCRFMPIRLCCTNNLQTFADAFGYAQAMRVDIINNSWGHTCPGGIVPTVVANAINNAAAAGIIVFFAGGNINTAGYCTASYPSLANVIAVSSSTNFDTRSIGNVAFASNCPGFTVGNAFGNCIDILAPSWNLDAGRLGVATTDKTGAVGYNNASSFCPLVPGLTEPMNTNYTNCFGGTSSASPLAAGIAGLVLSVNPTLTRVQLQRLLQDTADKIEDSAGSYDPNTGFSSPATGIATHGWGRVNAFEAVRVAAPVAQGGRDNVDIFLRDNRLDWGNTEQPSNTLFEPVRGFIPHNQSMDIKVDAPPHAMPTTSIAFDAFPDERLRSEVTNNVYVRVRNRGPVTASTVTVKLYYAYSGLGLPALQPDFWTAFPGDPSAGSWLSLGTRTIINLAYSGSSVAGTAADVAQIVQFELPNPEVPIGTPNLFTLFAVIDSPQDPVLPASMASFNVDNITPNDNNVSQKLGQLIGCKTTITSPAAGAVICDQVTVTGFTEVSAGLIPPFTFSCDVNGVSATISGNTFSATVPAQCTPGSPFSLIATCTVVDVQGQQVVCRDTLDVVCAPLPVCNVQITSPQEDDLFCTNSATVTGTHTVSSGIPPFITSCTVNGVPAALGVNTFTATVPLVSRDNFLIATCTVTDSCGHQAVCQDTIHVFLDDKPPICTFTSSGTSIIGEFFDGRSGIASFVPLELVNGTLAVDNFNAGDKRVDFRIDAIDPNKSIRFNIEITDVCGNSSICDPVFLYLTTDWDARQYELTFPILDRYFQVINHGLSEIWVNLNGNRFKFFSDPNRAAREVNAFAMPVEGAITIDLLPYLRDGENTMVIVFAGGAGANANLLLLDETQVVDYLLALQTIPVEFHLAQNYPNPFNPSTTIRFDVPERLAEGTPVQLRIYNILGELVRTLVDEKKFPGQYVAQWDGRNDRGEYVSAGIYIYRLQAGNFTETRRMVLMK